MRVVSQHDKKIVQELARKVAEVGTLPVMCERREMWKRHNRLERVRPMILVFPEGSWREVLPDSILQCEDKDARDVERSLRMRIYGHEHFCDDAVVEAEYLVGKAIRDTGCGLEPRRIESGSATGAWRFDPVIKEPADLNKLHFPEVTHDTVESARRVEWHKELLDDALPVRLVGKQYLSFHLMSIYTKLRGLEEVFLDMYDAPEMLHQAMSFFTEWHERLIQQYLDLDLLDFNNDGTYQNSGGVSYSTELPRPGFTPGKPRLCDLWASAEAQELAPVSPEMHEEFSLQYEQRLLEPFGLTGYGCCEDLTNKLEYVKRLSNMRRISISPFADVARSAEQLGDRYIFSWKPHPAYLVGDFDERKIREYLQSALEGTRGCIIEMILKDTHTCENHPERFTRWTEIAHSLAEKY